ncbi:hypothetical protein ACE1N8_00425 [Streptomyces sp. DSM 116494]|uniref:hypothetical protein n=1 Tax=Streptomyces okerensis TaxID=3344655 RepID=UPI00388F00BD
MVIAVLVLVLSGQDAHSAAATVVLVTGAGAESAVRLLGPASAGRKGRSSVRGRSE